MKRSISFLCSALFVFILYRAASAYEIPQQDSQAKYFCVFAAHVNHLDGAETADLSQTVYFDVPETEQGPLTIDIFDPDCGGRLDQKPAGQPRWDSIFEFAVYGKDGQLLQRERFSDDSEADMRYFTFGPFDKEAGQPADKGFRFKLVVRPVNTTFLLASDAVNLFKVRVLPDTVTSFTEKVSFRLLDGAGQRMYFYPFIPANTAEIIVENYDFDPDGATAFLYDQATGKYFDVNPSESGAWAQTKVAIDALAYPRFLTYTVNKKSQKFANASIRVKDVNGNPLPVYFSPVSQAASLPQQGSAPADQKELSVVAAHHAAVPVAPEVKNDVPPKTAAVAVKAHVAVRPQAPHGPCNKFTFDASGSFDPNTDKLSFLWDFGDGQTSTKPVVTHEFEKGGQYTVTLTVKDNSGLACDSSRTTQTVTANVPPRPACAAPESACVGEDIVFDASATTDDPDSTLTYAWDFGDGTKAEGVQATKRYEKGGSYAVKLTVDDNTATQCSKASLLKKITINTPPVARAGSNVLMCLTADKEYGVVFDAARSTDADGDKLTYAWDFGDGTKAEGRKVIRVYTNGGTYTVKLTVDDGRGTAGSKAEDSVTVVLNKKPVAAAGPDRVCAPQEDLSFDASGSSDADGEALTYTWDLGDGTKAQGIQVTHRYEKPGHYTVVLSVDDGRQTPCSVAQDTAAVYVNASPVAVLENAGPACVGSRVVFDAGRTVDDTPETLRYSWDFGDGTIAEGTKQMAHAFTKGGTYTVTVLVDDGKNTSCSTAMARTEVRVNTPPVAKAEPIFACCIDTDSVFDGSASFDADQDQLQYSWDLGDGTKAEGARVTHRYARGGTYTVVLTADDNAGTPCSRSKDSFKVRINDSPVAVMKVK